MDGQARQPDISIIIKIVQFVVFRFINMKKNNRKKRSLLWNITREIITLYVDKLMSIRSIMKHLKTKEHLTISKILKENNIKLREARFYSLKPINERETKSYIKLCSKRLHRTIIENYIGRKLTSKEIVHHVNGDRHDNRIENLVIMSRSEHMKIHMEDISKKHPTRGGRNAFHKRYSTRGHGAL